MSKHQRPTPYDDILLDLRNTNPQDQLTQQMTGILGHVINDHFDSHSEYIDLRRRLSGEEYIQLIKWAINNNKEASIQSLLSQELSGSYKNKLEELLKSVCNSDNADLHIFTVLLNNSSYLKKYIVQHRRTLNAVFGINGATIFHLLAYNGQFDFCQAILAAVPEIAYLTDYKGNNVLHYAAIRNVNNCFDKLSTLYPHLADEVNIFNHLPRQYQNNGFISLQTTGQNSLIQKFFKYTDINAKESSQEERDCIKEKIKTGLCYGFAFVGAVYNLRGENARNAYQLMHKLILSWDGSEDDLKREIADPYLQKQGFKTLGNIIAYLFNIYAYLQHMQNANSVIDLSKSDRNTQLATINMGSDTVQDLTSYVEVCMLKEKCKNIVLQHLNPNTILMINGTVTPSLFLEYGLSGHSMSLAIDSGKNIYFSEPNLAYHPIPFTQSTINIIVDLIYSQFDTASIFVYNYFPDKNLIPQDKSSSINYDNFFICKQNDIQMMITQAINHDSMHILQSCFNNEAVEFAPEYISERIVYAIETRSYSCALFMLEYFNIAVESLSLTDKLNEQFNNYLYNTIEKGNRVG